MRKNYNIKHLYRPFFILCILLVFSGANVCYAWSNWNIKSLAIQQERLTLKFNDAPLISILDEIQQKTNISFGFEKNLDPKKMGKYSLNLTGATIEQVMRELFKNSDYSYTIKGSKIIISIKETKQNGKNQGPIIFKGKVIDDGKKPLIGVTIILMNSTKGAVTDQSGEFSIAVQPKDKLELSYMGYKNEIVTVDKDVNNIVVILKEELVAVDDVVVVAYGQNQRKESLVGSVSTVTARQLKSSSSDLTTQLAGNVAGVIGWQNGGLPGALTEDEMNTKFYIRGITSFQSNANIDPLILLDGVEASKLDLARIDPEDIETFSVLKDASATAMYGARGANGVIYVTTKKGQSGDVYTSVRYESVMSMPTRDIEVISPVEYMKLHNEATIGRDPYASPKYTWEKIKNTNNPNLPYFVNPANDWYNSMFKEMSMNHRLGVNIRGGSDVVQYYASVNYNQDNGMLKTDRLNQFDVNIKNQGFTLRTNLNVDLTKQIKLVINSFSTLDKYHGPLTDVKQAYYMAFKANPVDFAVTYPADDYYKWNHIRFGGTPYDYNPYAELHEGYTDRMRYSTINRIEYIHDLSFITKGLEFRANASINQEGYFSTSFSTQPYLYTLKSYDYTTGKHELFPQNDGNRVLGSNPKDKTSTASTRIGFDVRLMHSAAWDRHQTSAILLFNMQEGLKALPNKLFNSFPQRNLSCAARFTYGFNDRYFAEGSFGLNGSERFAKQNRMGFFPSLGCSWVVSKEGFMEPLQRVIPFMKLRFSWGKVGNDGIINDPRFVHLSSISIKLIDNIRPTSGNLLGYTIDNYANPDVTWEIAEQMNLGLDIKFFNIAELNVDFYREIRHNVLDYRTTIPATIGLFKPAFDNVGKVDSRGVDLSLKIQHSFNKDFWVIFNGTFSYNRAKFLEIEEATNKPKWQIRNGNEISQTYGYIAEGLFVDKNEIENSPFQGGNIMEGDIRYRDINGDNKIDIYDAVPIGFPETPRVIYGFNGFINYKSFEFSFSFQGMGERSFFIDPKRISPFEKNKAVLKVIADDHWTPTNMSNKPFWPRLSTSNIIDHNPQEDYSANVETKKSTYFMNNGQFLRCKSIELGYNLPKKFVSKIKLRNIKMYVRTNNPFVITPFKLWDVELGGDGFNYPIQKTYSIGINVSF